MRRALAVLCLGVMAFPAFAAQQCYSSNEVEAEQLLRLHSELMVITVTCHQGSHGENLIPAYTDFTKNHIAALHDAEKTMIEYYHTTYGGNGIERLDKLRTKLGNEFGQKIADISAPIFCQQYRDKVLQMCSASNKEVQAEVERLTGDTKSYVKQCSPEQTRIAKKQ